MGMAIYRLLQEASFGPREITKMTTAYELALKRLKLSRTDPLTQPIAKAIIDGFRNGQRGSLQLCEHAIAAVAPPPRQCPKSASENWPSNRNHC
jgi:hypothetical protein